ncbi:MAG: UDP-N-acetylmuramate dehydrogenase [Bdellovibrionales bacterium]|nr:UDP-N-acetylmuramate dehydrogenase [Bdellovibrionales bacterium]
MSLAIDRNTDLKKYNSWKIGGPADHFCLPQTIDEMIEAVEYAKDLRLPITILGSGSNVLIPDSGLKGLVICTKKFKGLETQKTKERFVITAMAGEPKFSLAKAFIKENLPPGIFLSGLPGDVGGGIVMNAGIAEQMTPREFHEMTDWVEVLRDGQIIRFEKSQLQWSYRHCLGWEPGIIVRAGFSWSLADIDKTIKDKAAMFAKTRKDRQPLEMPSCGSTFVNPPGNSAGRLIQDSGLKGYQIGDAQVSLKHANFLVNLGNAKASDFVALISHIQKTVKEKFNIELKTEVKFL